MNRNKKNINLKCKSKTKALIHFGELGKFDEKIYNDKCEEIIKIFEPLPPAIAAACFVFLLENVANFYNFRILIDDESELTTVKDLLNDESYQYLRKIKL